MNYDTYHCQIQFFDYLSEKKKEKKKERKKKRKKSLKNMKIGKMITMELEAELLCRKNNPKVKFLSQQTFRTFTHKSTF